MLSATGRHGLSSSPHHLASQAGFSVLRKGGNAVEATIAAAAALGVVYPHMTGLGGDGFWLLLPGGRIPGARETSAGPMVIDACGASAQLASLAWYRQKGLDALTRRGPHASPRAGRHPGTPRL